MKTQLKEMMEVYALCKEINNEHDKTELINYIGKLHNRIMDLDCMIRNVNHSLNYEYPSDLTK